MPEISEIWAYITDESEEKDGSDEGVIAYRSGETWHPMVGADRERMESLRPTAQVLAESLGRTVSLVRFTERETVETLGPPSE